MIFGSYVPAPVRAVQLTSENLDELAAWIDAQPGCEVHWSGFTARGQHAFSISGFGQTEETALVGQWVIVKPALQAHPDGVYTGVKFEALTPEEFELVGYHPSAPQVE